MCVLQALRSPWFSEPEMTRFSRRENNVVLAGSALALAAGVVAVSNDSVSGVDTRGSTDPTVLVSYIVAIVALVIAVRGWRAGIYLDEEVLILRNPFRTYRFKWHEIEGFRIGSRPLFPGPATLLDLRDGRTVNVLPLCPPNPFFRSRNRAVDAIILHLNSWVERAR